MPVNVRVSGVNQTIAQARNEVEAEVNRELRRRLLAGFADVRLANPVDTGRSRNAWEFDRTGTQREDGFTFDDYEIINYVDYIQFLNEGTSPQAPAKFIENAFLRYFDDAEVEVYDDPRGGRP